VNISLDHWDSAAHNAFRGLPNSFQEVAKSAENVLKADLVLGLTLCATKLFYLKSISGSMLMLPSL